MAGKAKTPAIRFAGFADSWEHRQLGEIGYTISGIGFPDDEQYGKIGIPFFKVSDMNNTGNENEMLTANSYVCENQIARMKWKPITSVPAVIFAKVGAAIMLNRKRIVRTPFLLDNNTMAYIFDSSWDIDFGKTLFETINLPRYIQIGALPSYNGSNIEVIVAKLPSKLEQKKIATLFVNLDKLITLQRRKIEKLRDIKKSMLEKMFPKNGSDIPEIRCAGFTSAWEQNKLEEYLEVSNEKNTEDVYSKTDVLSVSGDYGIVNQIEFQGRSFAGASVSNYGVVHTGDIVYTKSPLNTNPYGVIKTNKGRTGIVSTLYAVYRPKENTLSEFVQTYFEQHARMNNYIHPLVNKGAKNDMKVSSENALKGLVVFPKREEQAAIYKIFAKLDYLITLHRWKFEMLQNLKKAFLEKMFV